jgi:iron complex transport system substrate-binding protein
MKCIYPNEYQTDIEKEVRVFYRLFLDVDVPNEEMKNVIYP